MKRRDFLWSGTALLLLNGVSKPASSDAQLEPNRSKARTGMLLESKEQWAELAEKVGVNLAPGEWPLAKCMEKPESSACADFFNSVRNPYFLGDHPGLTQTFGWVDAWTTQPSNYVLKARSAREIAEAVKFARKHDVRLVIKGGGHSYKGGSNAPNSLLVWMRQMDEIRIHDAFVPLDCTSEPAPAVSVGAGALWGQVYQEVSVQAGRYVQGGGCLSVGVAGLIQSGGFGSFSKAFGLAAGSLLEAEIVTADGVIRTVNTERDPELFFALKGGGGGTFGVVTRLTLQTHKLPRTFGAVFAEIRASSDTDYRNLIREMLSFYSQALFNPHWGEQIAVRPNNVLAISMVFQDLNQEEAERTWAPFFDWVRGRVDSYSLASQPTILAIPAPLFWDPAFLKTLPGIVLTDSRAARERIFWAGNREEAGQVIHAYQSAWLPSMLIADGAPEALTDALFRASRHWSVSLHTNKGLAGGQEAVRQAALSTAMNPAVVDAFALAICAAEGPPSYPGIVGHEPDLDRARVEAGRVKAAMDALRAEVCIAGSYLAESDYFEMDWKSAFWGKNYELLLNVKRKYDPQNTFYVHHGVG